MTYRNRTDMLADRTYGMSLGAEIGVMRGVNLANLLALRPDLTMYGIDPWSVPHGKWGAEDMSGFYLEAIRRLAPFQDRCFLIKGFSAEVSNSFEDASLDFVFIDGDHSYDSVVDDIIHWAPKVRKGGKLIGHDYYSFRWPEVTKAVRDVLGEEAKGIQTQEKCWCWEWKQKSAYM